MSPLFWVKKLYSYTVFYDVYQCKLWGDWMPRDWIVRSVKRGRLVVEKDVVSLVDDAGKDVLEPLTKVKSVALEDGVITYTGWQMWGSKSPKSKRWGNSPQQWLCVPAPPGS